MIKESLDILLIADVGSDSQHSAVEGLFKSRQDIGICCHKLFFDKIITAPQILSDRTILPHRYRRRGLVKTLNKIDNLKRYDVIIVRNLFSVLKQIQKSRLPSRIGFWESFPHSYRRLEQAFYENRAVWRKRIEYFIACRRERLLIQSCDFYLPITETHKSVYYPDLTIPYLPTPMGFDFDELHLKKHSERSGPIRFVYIGAIDKLRRFDIINKAFKAQHDDFILDYYSFQNNEVVKSIKRIKDPRIRFQGGFQREELFSKISTADVGICFFPHTKTHITASPTKTLEYGALGLTVLVNPMPEYETLLDNNCAFFCEFEEDAICNKIKEILTLNRSCLVEMGRKLQERVMEKRNYADKAKHLFSFIRNQCN